ncbi:ABC1 kinase family protein [Tomitella gaofuii]|uniref:ABC1 kinase family protein n=1 Tax=Tomitella gaofuii TaxID=2760083 RepID=UPI0015FBF996|nr:AarF/UbiB family protein [Tomitella gaofuii]
MTPPAVASGPGLAGTPGPVGPYADGPPPEALVVDVPPLSRVGVAELARAVVIAFVLVVSVAWAVVRWPWRRLRGSEATLAEAASLGVVGAFIALGPTFVKLGQLMASSSGVFPAPLADACLRCLDDVPPVPASAARRVVEEDLGHPVTEMFAAFDDVPLSAASVAQVHACELRDGRRAVIKVQRPGIRHRMLVDLHTAYAGAHLLERLIEFFRVANATAIIRDLHQATVGELNSALEATRQERLRENLWAFGDNAEVTAPEVYWDHCGPRVICMERLSGVPLDQFDQLKDSGRDTTLLIRRGVKAWLESIVVHGPFHGDVHAGNLWMLDDGRIALLDFGIVGELPETWRTILRDMFYATAIDGDFARVAVGIRALGYASGTAATDGEVGVQLQAVLAPVLAGDLAALRLSDLIMALIEVGRQWGAASPEELVLFGKQLGYFERYAAVLAPGWALGSDLYLFRNIFPDAVAAKAAATGVTLPD